MAINWNCWKTSTSFDGTERMDRTQYAPYMLNTRAQSPDINPVEN